MLEATVVVLRTGTPGRDLPERSGAQTTASERRAERGVWLAIFEALAARSPGSLAPSDGAILGTHPRAAGGHHQVPTTRQQRTRIGAPPALCRRRDPIERGFDRLEHFRRLATRFATLPRTDLATRAFAAVRP